MDTTPLGFQKPGARGTNPPTTELRDAVIANADLAEVKFQAIEGAPESTSNWTSGTRAARPAAGTLGRMYLATDQQTLWLDTGAAWVPMGPAPGDIKPYAGGTVPTGWLFCDGSAVARTGANVDLFATVGEAYGRGDGATTFNVPDLRGRAVMGSGQGVGLTNRSRGTKVGAETHQLTYNELPKHEHATVRTNNNGNSTLGFSFVTSNTAPTDELQHTEDKVFQPNTYNESTYSAHNNVQPSTVCPYLVKV